MLPTDHLLVDGTCCRRWFPPTLRSSMRSAPVSMLSQTTRLTGSCHREHLVCNRRTGLSLRASGMPLCCLPVPDAVGREGVAVTGSDHACHVVRRLMSKYALPVKDRAFSPSCREAPTQRLTKPDFSARLRRPTECSCGQSLSLGAVRGGRHDAVGSL